MYCILFQLMFVLLWGWCVSLFEVSVCFLIFWKRMSQFREAHKEDESEKKNSKMPQKRKKKEAEHYKVWLFHKNYLIKDWIYKWIYSISTITQTVSHCHDHVFCITIQETGVMSKDRLPLIGSSGNRTAGIVNTPPIDEFLLWNQQCIDMVYDKMVSDINWFDWKWSVFIRQI